MNRAKAIVTYLPKVRLRPEISQCPQCGIKLAYSHPVWAKPVYELTGARFVTSLGFRCPNPGCPQPKTVYRSALGESLSIKGSTYGLDVVVHIGHLWLHENRNRSEIHAQIKGRVPLSERHVQNLFESYLALLRCEQAGNVAQLPLLAQKQSGLVLSLDGLRPENGNESLYILREVLSGLVLWAVNLQEADQATLAALLKPVAALNLPILGVISDAQESIRLAVRQVFPGVPHGFCHFHVLREAVKPIFEADRHMKKEIKQQVRDLRGVERVVEKKLGMNPVADAHLPAPSPEPSSGPTPKGTLSLASPSRPEATEVVRDVAWAMRQTLLEKGQTPFQMGGLRVYEDLDILGQTVEYCLAKRGMLF
jgi:hypothetical protein